MGLTNYRIRRLRSSCLLLGQEPRRDLARIIRTLGFLLSQTCVAFSTTPITLPGTPSILWRSWHVRRGVFVRLPLNEVRRQIRDFAEPAFLPLCCRGRPFFPLR